MNKRWFLILCTGVLFAIFAGVYFFGVSTIEKQQTVVLKNKMLKVIFSNPIDKSSVNKKDIILEDNEGKQVPITFNISDDGKEIAISPAKDGYSIKTKDYRLVLSNGIKSRLGIPIIGNKDFHFTIAASLPTFKSKKQFREHMLEAKGQFAKMEFSAEKSSDTKSSKEYSETNTQVAGIDEGDLVKTDGEYIYSLSKNQVIVTESKNNKIRIASTIQLKKDSRPIEILLEKDKIIVVTENYQDVPLSSQERKNSISMTTVSIYDSSDKTNPKLLKEIGIEGNFTTSRKKGLYVYLVTNQHPNIWLLRENENIDLLPQIYDSKKGMYQQKVTDIQYMPESMAGDYTQIAAINIGEDQLPYHVETIVGSGNNIYMSHNNLYLAETKHGYENKTRRKNPYTNIYKFKIDELDVSFGSLGEVEGSVLNQFAMDENKKHFRIATTTYDTSSNEIRGESANKLSILNEKMKVIGEVGNLAKGERIYSVRFMEDKAYIVTFKETDPLFVIDTSNPEKPEVLGELKIPGYSTYLHPYDETHLIGFGYDTELVENGQGMAPWVMNKGMKVSLFDITDFNNPKEKDTVIIGGSGTQSALQYDHKALFQHKQKNLFGFPISVYEGTNNMNSKFAFQGAIMYEITPEKGIVLKAQLKNGEQKRIHEDWESAIHRIIYIDDNLYTVSNKNIKAYDLNDFDHEQTLTIPK